MVSSAVIFGVLNASLVEVQVEVKGLSEETVSHAFEDECGIVLLVGMEDASVFPSVYGVLQVPVEQLSEGFVHHLSSAGIYRFSLYS